MWPSQFWAVLRGSPRYLCLMQSQQCWVLAFLLQTPRQQNGHTVLRIASTLSHHGYYTRACFYPPSYIYNFQKLCSPLFFPIIDHVSLIFYCLCVYISKLGLCLGNGFLSSFIFLLFFSVYSQDENNSACNQRVLSREQQELQVSITIVVIGHFVLCGLKARCD